MKTISKALVGTVVAGAMAMTAAVPAQARDRYGRDDGISAGEVIAGAVVLGGLAAILSSGNNRDYRYNDSRYRDRNYRGGYNTGRYDNGRQAVEQCVRQAERTVQRYTGARAEVYEIRNVDRRGYGLRVRGRIAVEDRGWRGSRYDYRRNYRNNGWDEGSFTCETRGGRVVDLDFNGIRNL